MNLRLLILLVLSLGTASVAGAARRPNVLLVLVDDLKPVLGCYGDEQAITPHLDRFAREGVLFEHAYANQAVCAPSRHALLTGLRPDTIGVYDLKTDFRRGAPEAVTLPQRFQQAGYVTHSLGKVYHAGRMEPLDQASWTEPAWSPEGQYVLDPTGRPAMEFAAVDDEAYADGQIASEAIRRLRAAATDSSQPFFMAVGFRKPHLPFTAPRKYWDLHAEHGFAADGPAGPPVGAPAFAGHKWGELRAYDEIGDEAELAAPLSAALVRGYYAATSYVDAQVGRVLDALHELQLDDDTIVVVWGDHGWHLGDHGWWCKHTNYEQANHIPLLVRVPGVTPAGARAAGLVETVDLYPTLCDLVGLNPPRGLDGVSQQVALVDPAQSVREAALHVYPRKVKGETLIGRALRTARYRLVEWKNPGAAADTAILELYDYAVDPTETRNLASAGDHAKVLATLRATLASYPEARPPVQ